MSHEPASNYRFVETNQPLILYSRSHFQIFTPHPLILLLQRRTALQNKVKLYRYHITCKAILCIYISAFPIFSHSPHSSIIPPRQRMLNGCLFRCPVSCHEPDKQLPSVPLLCITNQQTIFQLSFRRARSEAVRNSNMQYSNALVRVSRTSFQLLIPCSIISAPPYIAGQSPERTY